jgi:hypothetical protein
MRLGAVLAGGDATRLPNKALLPLRNGLPMITSAIELCVRNNCTGAPLVIVRPDSLILSILHTWQYGVRYREQKEPRGLIDAILVATRSFGPQLQLLFREGNEEFLITFCDNYYDCNELIPVTAKPPCVAVRDVKKGHGKDLGTYRGKTIAGWLLLNRASLQLVSDCCPQMKLEDWLEAMDAQPIEMPSNLEWWDLGTKETYKNYWEDTGTAQVRDFRGRSSK